jgi:hypothetical protein
MPDNVKTMYMSMSTELLKPYAKSAEVSLNAS